MPNNRKMLHGRSRRTDTENVNIRFYSALMILLWYGHMIKNSKDYLEYLNNKYQVHNKEKG